MAVGERGKYESKFYRDIKLAGDLCNKTSLAVTVAADQQRRIIPSFRWIFFVIANWDFTLQIKKLKCTPHLTEDPDFSQAKENWMKADSRCKRVKPTSRDIVRRIHAILPYFDREHLNTQFIQKYRVTINQMSESMDLIDREASFYAAVLTPIMFLQRYRDARCLLERFEHALNQFQTFIPAEKRTALKYLQNTREISYKIRMFVSSLPDKKSPTRTPSLEVQVNEDIRDKKDIRFLKELIKNLG